MSKSHVVAALLAFGSLAVLSACSFDHDRQMSSNAPAPMPSPVSPDMVRQVQTTLQQQGMYKGAIDGVWGPATQSAVQNYQQSHNLPANGQLDSATLASLDLGNGAAPAANAAPQPPNSQASATYAPAPAANAQPPATNGQAPAQPPAAASTQ